MLTFNKNVPNKSRRPTYWPTLKNLLYTHRVQRYKELLFIDPFANIYLVGWANCHFSSQRRDLNLHCLHQWEVHSPQPCCLPLYYINWSLPKSMLVGGVCDNRSIQVSTSPLGCVVFVVTLSVAQHVKIPWIIN